MASPPNTDRRLATADTLLAAQGEVELDSRSFELATGEPSLIPVSVELAPTTLPVERYEPVTLLGAGGFGEVRLIKDTRIGRHIALKKLHPHMQDEAAAQRFLREARIQGQLEHPSVVPVYDLDFDEHGRPYFSMKRVRGLTLHKILDGLAKGDAEMEKRFGRRRLLTLFVQVCRALHYAHVRGVVHRDLKPGNIMIGDFGEVYVLDWGVARLMRDPASDLAEALPVALESTLGLTRQGDVVGSIHYMAPDQMDTKAKVIDARADVFALGVVLFEMLTLKRFRTPGSLAAVVERALAGERQRPRDAAPDVPPELDEICARCTRRKPDERVQTAGELAEAIEHYLEGDRDREARVKQSAEHTRAARARLQGKEADASERIESMREAVRALALDPDNVDAQALLVELVVDVHGPAPAAAESEISGAVDRLRARGARFAMIGFTLMLLTFPLALWLGIRSFTAIAVLSGITLCAIAFSFYASIKGAKAWHSHVLALLCAALVTATSLLAGPFVLVPTLAAAMVMYFVAHVSTGERRIAILLITLGAVAPYAIEALGLLPPAYAFEPDRIVLFARAVDFPKLPILVGLIYTSVTFVVLPAIFAGTLRDELMRAQRQIALQAWQLRQLFPTAPSHAPRR